MNTIEMLNKVHVGQKAYSESLNATILKDRIKGVVVLETKKNLQLNNFVLNTTDWEIVVERITDYNELIECINTFEGVTMHMQIKEGVDHWGFINKLSPHDTRISIEQLVNASWFRGKITMSELRERGLI